MNAATTARSSASNNSAIATAVPSKFRAASPALGSVWTMDKVRMARRLLSGTAFHELTRSRFDSGRTATSCEGNDRRGLVAFEGGYARFEVRDALQQR